MICFLQDDKPPTHMTSPGVIPVDLCIAEMVMRRTQDGIYHITGKWHMNTYFVVITQALEDLVIVGKNMLILTPAAMLNKGRFACST